MSIDEGAETETAKMNSKPEENKYAKSAEGKTLKKILDNRQKFINLLQQERTAIGEPSEISHADDETEVDRGMYVAVRTRPLFQPEINHGSFDMISVSNPRIVAHVPKIGLTGSPQFSNNSFELDYAFGPEDDNDTVYAALGRPMVRFVLDGGVSTIFAYGQTGSGKTYTMTAIEMRTAYDLFALQQPQHFDEHGQSLLKIFVSCFELLGNEASDLLNNHSPVQILEDTFGQVNIKDALEFEVNHPEELQSLIQRASEFRKTSSTFKNDTSSRSHAVFQIRVINTAIPAAENGRLFLIDLAGSERASDALYHDKSRLKETQAINKSLMCLKDCIRNRVKATKEPSKHLHIPYRQSKLTHLLKDAFELESFRLCKSVVIACISPSAVDHSHTVNTLRYAAPIKVAVLNKKVTEFTDPDDPSGWTNAQLADWVSVKSKNKVNTDILCPFETGLQICRLPEAEFIRRLLQASTYGEKRAKMFYVELWGLVIDARTRAREKKMPFSEDTKERNLGKKISKQKFIARSKADSKENFNFLDKKPRRVLRD
eukprot:CAMPEP_0115024786 /NCGR_PEP_ID=MMETSP0216-20121206/33511_1 /TAXON_ID=223996 /ORGANISM="Protocruzia adherens, Strain Boccale" /LENGTH=543 /DNA_ID=CAMNT_0002399043 /DNA_START=69 /DNA_END=1700 /DNA_ORIENTATION=-